MSVKNYILTVDGKQVSATYTQKAVDDLFLPFLKSIILLQSSLNRRIIVFVSAPPATGKSTLLALLPHLAETELGCDKVECVGMDGFHYSNEYLESFDLLSQKGSILTFDVEKLHKKLKELCETPVGDPVIFPRYDRNIHATVEEGVLISKEIILVEGNYLSATEESWQALQQFCDYSVFVEADPEELKLRLIARKMQGGWSEEEATEFFHQSDSKNIEYVMSHRSKVDCVWVYGDNDFSKVLS